MVGTGPFMFKEWVPNDHVTIVKNPDYWNKDGMAHLDEVIYKPFADQSAELNALQSDGGIDLAQTILPNDVAALKADPTYTVIDRGESCNYGGLQMNQTHKPFDNLHIRTAIAYAVNKQSYIDAFYAGLAEPADNWMPPATQYYKKLNLPTYDPQKAKDEIAASGRQRRTSSRSTSTTRPTSPDRTCPTRRAWPRRSRPTSRPSASRSPSTPRAGGPATWPTRPSGSTRCGSSAGPATGRDPTTSSTRRSSTSTATSRTRSSPTVRRTLKAAFDAAPERADDADGEGGLGAGPGHPGPRPADRPARPLQAAGRVEGLRQGLPRRRQPQRAARVRLARQVGCRPGSR